MNPSNELGLEVVLEVLENDAETVQLLYEHGVLHEGATTFAAHDVEVARLARTLLRDLEVNWEGTEIILRLRDELLATRRQVADLLELMRSGGPSLI